MKVKLVLIFISMVVSTTMLVAQKVDKTNPANVLATPTVSSKHIIPKQPVIPNTEQDQHTRNRIQIKLANHGAIRNSESTTDRPGNRRVIYISKENLSAHSSTAKDAKELMELAKQRSRKH